MSNKTTTVTAIIVAAGGSKRMEGIDKVFAPLGGEPVLVRATRPFQECGLINSIIIVVGRDKERRCRALVTGPEWSKVTGVCVGGRRRQDSVAAGLELLKDCDWVIIHDGARPLVTIDIIQRGLEAAEETGAAVAAVPVTDTIKAVDESEIVVQTPQRRNLRSVQTPQVFRSKIIKEAYERISEDVTDDASLVEKLGYKVKLYPGSYDNIKITTPDDLALAEAVLKKYGK